MKCVVCSAAVAEPHFANPWEKARKLYACCTEACAARFDPDVHWFPAVAPPALALPDEARLLTAARRRIVDGDRPSLVVRDMLIAGVGIAGVRKLIVDGELAANRDDRTARKLTLLGVISGLLGGALRVSQRASKQQTELLRAAAEDIAAWQTYFGIGDAAGPRPNLA